MSSDEARVWACENRIIEHMGERTDLSVAEQEFIGRRLETGPPSSLTTASEVALREGRYRDAARLLDTAARICPHERRLVAKAALLRACPPAVGPALRRHLVPLEA